MKAAPTSARWARGVACLALATVALPLEARAQTQIQPPGAPTAPAPAAPPAAPAPPPPPPPPPAPPPPPPPVAAAPPPVAPVAPPASSAGEPSPTETSAEVLRLYVAEDDAGALRAVQAGLDRCDAASRRVCPDAGKALLLRDLGIVQAGAYRDHAAAVTAFREALRLDPTVSIPPDLLVDRVRDAFEEAGGKIGKPAATAPVASATAQPAPAAPEEKKSRYDAGDVFVLVNGTWGGSSWIGDISGEGGAVVAGLWHVAGPLAVGPRVTVGGTIATTVFTSTGQEIQVGPYGFVGASAVVGLLPRGKRNTGFFLFSFGPDYFPELGRARTVGTFTAGASIGGFVIGGGPGFILDQGESSGAMWLVVGWGNYVKDEPGSAR